MTDETPSLRDTLPPHVARKAQRILDAAAARLLAERLERDATDTAARRNPDRGERRADQRAALRQ
jgi:hypothetical protein